MQAAVHTLPPPLLSHYSRQSLNGVGSNGAGPSVMPTPPVATTRKRKRANQDFTISYSEVQEVDSDGRLREVIVIDDTPPPTMSPTTTHTGAFSASYQPPLYSAPIRTRARAAAEAQALSVSSSSAIVAPPPKKRKREHLDHVRALPSKKAAPSNHQTHVLATKSWDSRSAANTDEVCIDFLLIVGYTYLTHYLIISRHPRVRYRVTTRRVITLSFQTT